MKPVKLYLSKSQFIRGLQCHKSLWLYKYKSELRTPPDEAQQAIFDTGTEVGLLAQKLFPDGKKITYEKGSFAEKIQRTKELIDEGAETIYEATFSHNGILAMVDILHKGNYDWEIYEVKSTTQVKDVHLSDLSIQYLVVSGYGIPISKASLVHINNQYVKSGNLNIQELFTNVNLTNQVEENQGFVSDRLCSMQEMMEGECPAIDIGYHCNTPYPCDFKEYCWSHIPEYSVFNISGLGTRKKFDLYSKGILNFNDIPEDYEFSPNQRVQIESEVVGKDTINKEGIKEFLECLKYPLYFLDFETIGSAIPFFNGTRPYQNIPFQYSLHFKKSEEADVKHYEFLAKEGVDEREELAKKLTLEIPKNACILTYNMGFEKRVLSDLAEQFTKYSQKLLLIRDNIQDLMFPFQKKYFYNSEMKGRYSLKYVLPALLPELSYKGMEISNGMEASNTFAKLHLVQDKKKVEQTRDDLLEYCKLDTYAMVKLLVKLRETVL